MYLLKTLDNEYFFSNSDGGDVSVSIVDEIADEDYKYLSSTPDSYKIENDKVVILIPIDTIKKNEIRKRRDTECFSIVDRGELWYNSLTEEQSSGLKQWYQNWLNAPETGEIPDKPDWLR